MAKIRPCAGTTAQWEAVKGRLVLLDREIGIETKADGSVAIRMGDGESDFFDLPVLVDGGRYEEILSGVEGYLSDAQSAAETATTQAEVAESASAAATAAKAEAMAAKSDAQDAAASAEEHRDAAAQSAAEAARTAQDVFSATPDGFEELVQRVDALEDVEYDAASKTLTLRRATQG